MENKISRNVWRNLINCHLSIVTFTVYFFYQRTTTPQFTPKRELATCTLLT
jgi:hypothetical protein